MRITNQQGMSIIEVLIGLMLLTVVVVGVSTQISALQLSNQKISNYDEQLKLAKMIMNDISLRAKTDYPGQKSINLKSNQAIAGFFANFNQRWKGQGGSIQSLVAQGEASIELSIYENNADLIQAIVTIGEITLTKVLTKPEI